MASRTVSLPRKEQGQGNPVVSGFFDANLHGFGGGHLSQAVVAVDVRDGAFVANQLDPGGNVEQAVSTAFGNQRYESTAMGANTPHVGFNQNGCHQPGLPIFSPQRLQQCSNDLDQVIGSNSQS